MVHQVIEGKKSNLSQREPLGSRMDGNLRMTVGGSTGDIWVDVNTVKKVGYGIDYSIRLESV